MPLRELELIQRIRRAARAHPAGVGIGDDCAVLDVPPGQQILVTTDFSLEDVHFRQEWHPADSVGHRCLARGLSDIAAMGGKPHSAFLSLALPALLPQSWVDGFIRGLLKLARAYRVTLAGGDTAQSPSGIAADIVVVGTIPAGSAVLRSGAQPGDAIYVTGKMGESVATLHALRDGAEPKPASHRRHFYPEPRVRIGQFLREKKIAKAMIDLSDGLSSDLQHICDESGCGAVVRAADVPRGGNRLELALHGGEDYELLFTASPKRKVPSSIASIAVTRIGEITRGKGMQLQLEDGKRVKLEAKGWEHFS